MEKFFCRCWSTVVYQVHSHLKNAVLFIVEIKGYYEVLGKQRFSWSALQTVPRRYFPEFLPNLWLRRPITNIFPLIKIFKLWQPPCCPSLMSVQWITAFFFYHANPYKKLWAICRCLSSYVVIYLMLTLADDNVTILLLIWHASPLFFQYFNVAPNPV